MDDSNTPGLSSMKPTFMSHAKLKNIYIVYAM